MTQERLLCVSVDLDSLACYHAIHAMKPPSDAELDLHCTLGLVRHLGMFAELDVTATLFAVGQDLERPACADVVRRAHEAGHEVANHTYSHPYDFSRLPPSRLIEEMEAGARCIEDATGRPPAGFRAPGYHLGPDVVSALEKQGYLYDASLLPSPPYYLAKMAVMASLAVTGSRSRAIAGGPGMTLAPNRPYRMGRTYWLPGNGLVELPCTVIPALRLPFIGTSLSLAGRWLAVRAARLLSRRRFVGLELHAIDLMDADGDGLLDLGEHQPDLRIPLRTKREILSAVISTLIGAGFRPVTLERAAALMFGGR